LKQIRYFIAAAESGRISRAAVELNVSQSAVTVAVQQFEGTLGVRLFERNSSGVSLTREGNRFLQHGRNVMAAVVEAVREPRAASAAIAGTVRVSVTYTVAGYFLATPSRPFRQQLSECVARSLPSVARCHRTSIA